MTLLARIGPSPPLDPPPSQTVAQAGEGTTCRFQGHPFTEATHQSWGRDASTGAALSPPRGCSSTATLARIVAPSPLACGHLPCAPEHSQPGPSNRRSTSTARHATASTTPVLLQPTPCNSLPAMPAANQWKLLDPTSSPRHTNLFHTRPTFHLRFAEWHPNKPLERAATSHYGPPANPTRWATICPTPASTTPSLSSTLIELRRIVATDSRAVLLTASQSHHRVFSQTCARRARSPNECRQGSTFAARKPS